MKRFHEIRDPIHVFIRLSTDERKVLDSRPFQRLRQIHQLALTYLVYPGATHKRFEHSLGVMELAGRVYDVITDAENVSKRVEDVLPATEKMKHYWKEVVQMAALCHDLGHLPFSHAAEKELLPQGWSHEHLTWRLVLSEEMKAIWHDLRVEPMDVAKISVGPRKAAQIDPNATFTPWEAIASEIIVGDAFGVDRMDYLLRDAYHAGVRYGRFDHHRLIDTLRILPIPPADDATNEPGALDYEPALGVELGGLQSAEALLLARYAMYSQMYLHHIRRIYDRHLQDFLSAWLPQGKSPTDLEAHLRMTDNEVMAAIYDARCNVTHKLHSLALRVLARGHFKVLYRRDPSDLTLALEPGLAIYEAAKRAFGDDAVRHDRYTQKGSAHNFPVDHGHGNVVPSVSLSETLKHIPAVSIDYVFIDPAFRGKAEKWLQQKKNDILSKEVI